MSLSKLLAHLNPLKTPQSEPVPGKPTVPNSAGGYAFAVDDWARFDRFLVLGSEGGTYYVSEKKLTTENAAVAIRCAKADGAEAVRRIVAVSTAGRAPKNSPAILALALVAEHGKPEVKQAAYKAVPQVCRTGTHLFEFVTAKKALGGAFGAGMRRAVGRWYTEKPADKLAYQVVKYRQRDGMTHRDVLRLARPAGTPEVDTILRWAVRGANGLGVVEKVPKQGSEAPARTYAPAGELPPLMRAFDELQQLAQGKADPIVVARFVAEHKLPRECVPSEYLTSKAVWEALFADMPLTAMVRNLATMTRIGLITPNSDAVRTACERLRNVDRLKKARLHPLALLLALRTYAAGKGDRGKNTWAPVQPVCDALNDAFYAAFGTVRPTGKRWLLAIDVSGSMGSAFIGGTSLSCREASAAMAMVTAAVEPAFEIVGFTAAANGHGGMWGGETSTLTRVPISARTRLDDAVKTVGNLPMGGTDCALPMIWAAERKVPVDVFAVYTDSETWAGNIHPFQALQEYRQKMGIPAKLAVVGMTSNGFTIADPSDNGMLDVVGFDTTVPEVLRWFAGGEAEGAGGVEE